MAEKLQFDLVSPERRLISEAVDMVIVPGSMGDFGVLAGHAPLISTLRPGMLQVEADGQDTRRIFVRGGFAEVTPEGLNVLAEFAVPLEELDAADLDQQIKDTQEDVNDATSEEARSAAMHHLEELRQVRDAVAAQ